MKEGATKRKAFSLEHLRQLEKLSALPDDQIDTGDIPETAAENWAYARRGEFYRPIKRPITIRLDADVIEWFKDNTQGGYQTEINRILRNYVADVVRRRS